MIAVSIVSHGHGGMISSLIAALLACPEVSQILVTRNIPEALDLPAHPSLTILDNPQPKGFAANHNGAFAHCHQAWFCPLNPDVILCGNPFPALLATQQAMQATVMAPLVLNPQGGIEDSVRYFPTLGSLCKKVLFGEPGTYRLVKDSAPVFVDWAAGMFLLIDARAYAALQGFDEGFFLYYEDVDLCLRVWQRGLSVAVDPAVTIAHDARRDSHRKVRYLVWHLRSLVRYLGKWCGRIPDVAKISGSQSAAHR